MRIRCQTSAGARWRGVYAASEGLAVASTPHFAVWPSSRAEGSRSEPRALVMIVMSRSGWQRVAIAQFTWRSRSEEHTSELQSRLHLVCRLLLEKKKHQRPQMTV